jgi:hypothetical protein
MKLYSFMLAAVLSTLALTAPSAQAQTDSAPQLDYARTLQQSDMVFVPYIGMNRGPIYYTKYEQVPTAPSSVGGLRRIIVNLWPAAHRQNLYNDFVSRNGITDARLIPVPEFGSCQPTEEIKTMLAGMPDGYKPRILPGNYPIICSLSLYFLPEDEASIRAVIAARPVIVLRATIPLCDPSSPKVDVPHINQRLLADGVLQTDSYNNATGNSWDVLFESARLAQLNPSLFATPDPQEGWEAYMKAFTLELDAETAEMTATTASRPLYICTPAPLFLQFG